MSSVEPNTPRQRRLTERALLMHNTVNDKQLKKLAKEKAGLPPSQPGSCSASVFLSGYLEESEDCDFNSTKRRSYIREWEENDAMAAAFRAKEEKLWNEAAAHENTGASAINPMADPEIEVPLLPHPHDTNIEEKTPLPQEFQRSASTKSHKLWRERVIVHQPRPVISLAPSESANVSRMPTAKENMFIIPSLGDDRFGMPSTPDELSWHSLPPELALMVDFGTYKYTLGPDGEGIVTFEEPAVPARFSTENEDMEMSASFIGKLPLPDKRIDDPHVSMPDAVSDGYPLSPDPCMDIISGPIVQYPKYKTKWAFNRSLAEGPSYPPPNKKPTPSEPEKTNEQQDSSVPEDIAVHEETLANDAERLIKTPSALDDEQQTILPLHFPKYNHVTNQSQLGFLLDRADYAICVGARPLRDLRYGVIIVPIGEEHMVFGPRIGPPELEAALEFSPFLRSDEVVNIQAGVTQYVPPPLPTEVEADPQNTEITPQVEATKSNIADGTPEPAKNGKPRAKSLALPAAKRVRGRPKGRKPVVGEQATPSFVEPVKNAMKRKSAPANESPRRRSKRIKVNET